MKQFVTIAWAIKKVLIQATLSDSLSQEVAFSPRALHHSLHIYTHRHHSLETMCLPIILLTIRFAIGLTDPVETALATALASLDARAPANRALEILPNIAILNNGARGETRTLRH